MSTGPTKVFIKVESSAEQQENLRNSRKSLKVLQRTATDKENLVGRTTLIQKGLFTKSKSETEISDNASENKRKKLVTHGSQTDPAKVELARITEEDLTDGEPSEGYWKILAEKRRVALDLSLKENEELYDRVNNLEDELNTSRAMLEETRNLVEVLTEMLQEGEPTNDFETGECSKDLINASLAEEASEEHQVINESTPVTKIDDDSDEN